MKVEKCADLVALYLTTYASYAIQGSIPDTPMDSAKGSWRPPATDAFDRFTEANRIPASYIDPLTADIRRSGKSYGTVRFATLLGILDNDPGCVRRWQDETDNNLLDAWNHMCLLVAHVILSEHPHVSFNVVVSPKDKPQPDKPTAAYEDRKRSTRDTNRVIVDELQALQRDTGKSGWEAYWELHIRVKDDPKRGWSVARIRDALKKVNAERSVA